MQLYVAFAVREALMEENMPATIAKFSTNFFKSKQLFLLLQV